MKLKAHHIKLADALLAAVKQHSDHLDTVVTVRENGRLICTVERDSPNFGPTVRFAEEPEA